MLCLIFSKGVASNIVSHLIFDDHLSVEVLDEALAEAGTFSIGELFRCISEIALRDASLRCKESSRVVGLGSFHAGVVIVVGVGDVRSDLGLEMRHPFPFF